MCLILSIYSPSILGFIVLIKIVPKPQIYLCIDDMVEGRSRDSDNNTSSYFEDIK